jgi:hypothetical protein
MAEHTASRSGISLLRRDIVGVIIVAFAIAAVMGIIVLLGGGMGDTAFRVLGTTTVVGSFSIGVLCCAALIGRRAQVFGIVGVIVTVLSAALAVWFIWVDVQDFWDASFRLLWTGVAASAAFALACLLLLLADRSRSAVRIGLWVTLALIALLLALTLYLIWARDIPWEDFARLYGIVAILTALGAIVVPVMSLLMPDRRQASALPPELAAQLEAAAQARGITVAQLVAPVLAAPAPGAGAPAAAADESA